MPGLLVTMDDTVYKYTMLKNVYFWRGGRMDPRWSTALGASLLGAAMSGMLLAGAVTAWADTDTDTGGPAGASAPDAAGQRRDAATTRGGTSSGSGMSEASAGTDSESVPGNRTESVPGNRTESATEVADQEPPDLQDGPDSSSAQPESGPVGDAEEHAAVDPATPAPADPLDEAVPEPGADPAPETASQTGSERTAGTAVAGHRADGDVDPAPKPDRSPAALPTATEKIVVEIQTATDAEQSEITATVSAATSTVTATEPAAAKAGQIEQATVMFAGRPGAATASRAPSIVNVIGSLVMNLLIGLVHLIDGPPRLPTGSTVTVRTSSLYLPIGTGRKVQADWYFPENADESTRLVYLQHGFMASGPMYSYTAARLAERTNSIVVAPSLSSNFFDTNAEWVGGSTMQKAVAQLFTGGRTALTESASAAAGYEVTLPEKFALVGHSAGGTLVTAVAGHLADADALDDLVGVVMLDGVEPKGSHAVNNALEKLRGDHYVPIYLISSQRYMWDRHGDMADKLMTARPDDFNGVGLTGGTHIDYMEGANTLLQFAEYLTAGFSHRENIDAAGIITAGWINDLFDSGAATRAGIYGNPGERIAVATATKPATAVVLPLGPAGPSPLGEFLDSLLTNVFEFAGEYLFVYEPLQTTVR